MIDIDDGGANERTERVSQPYIKPISVEPSQSAIVLHIFEVVTVRIDFADTGQRAKKAAQSNRVGSHGGWHFQPPVVDGGFGGCRVKLKHYRMFSGGEKRAEPLSRERAVVARRIDGTVSTKVFAN